jgi:ribosomal protein S19E (S16A)
VEKNIGTLPKLAYLIVNDIKQFGFLQEDEHGYLRITPRGERALQGISRRLYEKRFTPEMLVAYHESESLQREDQQRSDQATLF